MQTVLSQLSTSSQNELLNDTASDIVGYSNGPDPLGENDEKEEKEEKKEEENV